MHDGRSFSSEKIIFVLAEALEANILEETKSQIPIDFFIGIWDFYYWDFKLNSSDNTQNRTNNILNSNGNGQETNDSRNRHNS